MGHSPSATGPGGGFRSTMGWIWHSLVSEVRGSEARLVSRIMQGYMALLSTRTSVTSVTGQSRYALP